VRLPETHTAVTVYGVLALVALVPIVWAMVDVLRRPAWQFPVARKVVWVVMLLAGWVLVFPVAAASAVLYLVVLRRRMVTVGSPSPAPSPSHAATAVALPAAAVVPAQSVVAPSVPLPPFGWYPDPAGSAMQRWWDGRGWTELLRNAG
jgi:hypothetical protein